MFALVMAEDRLSFQPRCRDIIDGLKNLQDQVKKVLAQDKKILSIAEKLHKAKSVVVRDCVYEKCLNALEQVKSRKGQPILICEENDEKTISFVPEHGQYIEVPKTVDALQSVLTVIPMQLLSYHMAVLRGCNVDQPRNLAKSVTVE